MDDASCGPVSVELRFMAGNRVADGTGMDLTVSSTAWSL